MNRVLCTLAMLGLAALAFGQRPGPPPVEQGQRPQDGPLRILKWVIDSAPKQRFSGQRTMELVVEGQPVQLVEFVWRDGHKTRIEYPENSPRKGFIIVEREGERLEFDPGRNEIRRRRGDMGGPDFVLERIRGAFSQGHVRVFEFESADVAGRKTIGLSVSDPQGNVAQKFWIDREKGVILAAVQYGRGGERRGYFEFTRINFEPTFPQGAFDIVRRGARLVDEASGPQVPWKVVVPTWLPDGFRETSRNVRQAGGHQVLVIHYSDGRRHMTLFQAPGRREFVLPPREASQGKTLMSGRVGDVWVAVLADLDARAVDAVLKSLRASE